VTTFAALGDSITLGVGDPAPDGGWRGWAALLAQSLRGGRLVNLAGNGAKAADVERAQLPRALELRPDVASVVVGINDTLRAGFDGARIQAALAHVAGSLSAAGAVVLTMRLPDPGMMLGLPAALARPLGRRLQVINEAMDQVAEQFGTLHFDAAADLATCDRRMWSADRLHPSERGHRYIAGRFHDQLAARRIPLGPRPGVEPTSPPPTRLDTAAWMATKGTAWVLRRCTDLVPYLLFMALREYWPGPGPQPQVLPPLLLPEPAAADPGPAPEAGMPQAGMPQAGMPQAGMPQAGMPQAGMPQAGMPQAGVPEIGVPEIGHAP
jgi:lysophospholipase L1-like esterase